MVGEIFRNALFYKDDTSVDFNLMRDKENPSYSLILIKIFNILVNEKIKIYEKTL